MKYGGLNNKWQESEKAVGISSAKVPRVLLETFVQMFVLKALGMMPINFNAKKYTP